jgi:transcriptional regulator with XRE-family HTH domain
MTPNKEKFLALVSKEKNNTLEKNSERIRNRAMLRESQKIAIKVLKKLDEMGWSQKDLARELNVSPQHINKIVKGQENLTLETQIKLQSVLDIPILASYYDSKTDVIGEFIFTVEKKTQQVEVSLGQVTGNYQSSKTIIMEFDKLSKVYSNYQEAI